ncbi:hypothetical protein MUK42_36070 [Musa troglodytarum]|uniref:Uncharacterized protein n=1 Tax=Musa troglodytarum TaxID=320322 RepID=A0A9E7KR14_9LILI|nr:hypothetical protein MUK42_36070 [Musa troglodytarum]
MPPPGRTAIKAFPPYCLCAAGLSFRSICFLPEDGLIKELEPLQPSLRPPAMQTVAAKSKEMVHEPPEVHERPGVSGRRDGGSSCASTFVLPSEGWAKGMARRFNSELEPAGISVVAFGCRR